MKKITLFLFLSLCTVFLSSAQQERVATGIRNAQFSQLNKGNNRALTTIYETSHTGTSGAEITATANGPSTSMADAIVLAGTNRILQTVTVELFNLTSEASYDLRLRIYSDCTTNGASGACGSGPGALIPGSDVIQTVTPTPGSLGFIYSVTFTLPNVNLYTEIDNNISVSLNASRNDVFWILGENVSIGSQPAGEPALSVVERCGSTAGNNGCARNFGIQNNFSLELEAEAAPPNDLCANAISITTDGSINGSTVFGTVDSGNPDCIPATITSPGVWYVFTDNTGTGSTVDLDLCSGTAFDTKLSVYTGSCGSLTCVVGNDDSCGLQSAVQFTTNGSSTYYILVHASGGATGTFSLNVSGLPIVVIGDPPVIACPADIIANNDPGTCGAIVNFAGVAFDTEDGNISGDIVATPPSGSVFPVGDTTVELSVTDSDGNTSTCEFNISVLDNEAPVAVCQDLTVEIDPTTGTATITAAEVDNGSTDNCGIDTMTLDVSSFDCSMTGANTVTMTVTDNAGNTTTCTSTVTVQDTTAPDIVCVGGFGTFTETEDFEGASIPTGWTTEIGAGVQDWTFGSGSLPSGDDFPSNAAIFDDDAAGSGNTNLATLISPAYDLTNASNVVLGYDVAFQEFGDQEFTVEVFDGATWQQVALYDANLVPNIQPASIDVSAYANPAFQVRYVYDDLGGWGWAAGVDNFSLTYDAPSGSGLDVILDANGMASIDPNDLLTSINEACGYTITAGGVGGGTMESLATTFVGGNGNFGNMFDVNSITDVIIDSFDINADTGATFDVEVYAKVGTWVGFEADPAAWTLIGTAVGVVSNGDGVATPLNLALNYEMAAGETHAFYVTPTDFSTGGLNYTDGTATGNVFASDANIEFLEGGARGYPFSGSTFQPRVFNGNILYTTGGGSGLDFTCDDLGQNLVEVTVTDDSGNSSTCIAVVNVIDVTAPIITCGPEPTISETVSDSPALAIPDNDPAGVTSIISISEDVTITDIDVNLDITHTWVGDIITTITSPAGTSVTIVDRIGYTGTGFGCNGDNILATLDDAAATPVETECGAGIPSIDGTFSPNNPLSAFNGESTLGDWTITISDNAAGDTGTLNAWGITYSYANSNTDVVIELGPDGTATIDPFDIISSVDEACGIDTAAVDVPIVSCSDIGTTILVTVFVTDASGNLASCSANVTVVDLLAPELTCPADQTVDPGAGNLFYIVPDYFANGEATAEDNCTDPVTIFTQDPAPGASLPDGTYTVTLTATDEYGNTSTCDFELTVDSIVGVDENSLDAGLALYPNPAGSVVNLVNKTNISLEKMMIYDINGKLVSQTDLRTMQGQQAVDVSSLASGVYVVQIIGENASTTKRLIKE